MTMNRRQAGFSLTALGVATAVVAAALLGVTLVTVVAASFSRDAARLRSAARAVSTVMEDVRATDLADVVATFDGHVLDITSTPSDPDYGTVEVTVRQVPNGSAAHRVYEVTLDVQFDGADRGFVQPIVAYVSDRRAGSALAVPKRVAAAAADPSGDSAARRDQ